MKRIVEAGWLGVVLWVPLVFDPFGARAFAPAKAWVLRGLAVVMVAAFAFRLMDADVRERLRARLGHPLVWCVFALTACAILSTVTSIAVRKSFFGDYFQQHGLLTTLSLLAVFFVMAVELRTRAQLFRLLTALVGSATLVAAYGGAQRLGLDPIPWIESMQHPVSTVGNPIFLGGYLVVASLLTLGWCLHALSQRRWMTVALTGSSTLLQWTVIVITGTRGPLLALLASLSLGVLVFAAVGARVQLRRIVTAAAALALLVVSLLAWGPGFLDPLRGVPGVGDYVGFARIESPTGAVRRWLWQGAAGATLDPPQRALWGHGLDTAQLVIPAHVHSKLGVYEARPVLTRTHNSLWDYLVGQGFLGAIAWMLFLAAVLALASKQAGGRRSVALLQFMAVGAGVGVAVSVFAGVEFVGVLAPLGTIAGLGVHWIRDAFARNEAEPVPFLALAALLALTAHVLETLVGIATLSSLSLLWVLAALVVVMPDLTGDDEGIAPTPALAVLAVLGAGAFSIARYAWRDPQTFVTANDAAEIARELMRPAASLAMVMGGLLVLTAVALSLVAGEPRVERPWWRTALLPIPLLLAVSAGWLGLKQLRADIVFKVARDDLHKQRHVAEAVTLYGAAIDELPHEDYYLLFRSKAYLDLGELDRAQSDIARAHELSPHEPNLSYAHARILRRRALEAEDPGDRRAFLQASLVHFAQGAAKQPFAVELWIDWALTLGELGRGNEGLEKLEHVQGDMPKNPGLYVYKGQIYGSMGKLDEAEAQFEHALQLRENYVDAIQGLALVKMQRRDYDAAWRLLKTAADRQWRDAGLQLLAARTMANAGELELARTYGNKAQRLAPDNPEIRQFLRALEESEPDEGENP